MRKLALAAALGIAALSMAGVGVGERAAVMPRRQELPKPPVSREERKRRERRFSSLPRRVIRALNRPYVAHERSQGGDALCGRPADWMNQTHRFCEAGEPVMCNGCQRVAVKLERQRRGGRP